MFERVKQLRRMVFSRGAQRWMFFSPGQRKFMRKVGDGSASSVVTAPLLWIGRNFPEAPPALWEKSADSGEEERVTGRGNLGGDHPMLELMERPNPFYTGALLWMATIIDYHLSGNGYWIKIRDQGGRPIEMWWTPSPMLEPKGDVETFVDHYDYRVGSETHEIPPEDVVHFRYALDPEDPRKGRSPLSALLQEVFTDTEAADFTATLLGNMGVPGVVVAPKGDASPTDDDVKATKSYMKEAFTGDRRGEPLVMSGPTSVAQFGFSPQQLALREIRRIPEERVSAALGVPAIVAGLGAGLDRSTFTNYGEARQAAYYDNIIPAQRLLSEDIRFQLLPDFEPDSYRSFRFGFDLSNVRVLQEDRNNLAARLNIGVQGGWVRVSEARRAVELEVDKADEIYLRALNMVEVPVGGFVPALPPLSPGTEPAQPTPNGQMPPGMPEMVAARRRKFKARRPTRLQTRLAYTLLRDQRALAAVFAKELETEFMGWGDACADTYLQLVPQQAQYQNGNNKALTVEQLARLVVASLTVSFNDAMRKRFEAHITRVLTQTLDTINNIASVGVGVSDVVQRQLIAAGGKRVGLLDIDKQTRTSLFNAINEGNQAGLGPRQIARNIREEVPRGPYPQAGAGYRAQLISRTETNWAQNTSSLAAYREADVVNSVVAIDGNDDPECADRNGQEFSFDEAEVELENEHPNGTLTFAPVVGEEVPV